VVGDVGGTDGTVVREKRTSPVNDAGEVAYETLCRRHHMRRMAAADARASELSPAVLQLDGDVNGHSVFDLSDSGRAGGR
jgi:thymidine kinase